MTSRRSTMVLQDDQKFSLMKFRRNVHDILRPEHDDFFLIRWLNARKWDIDAAELMLRESFKWRERWCVDTIKDWPTPKALIDWSPHGLSGFDKEGSPFIIVPFAGFDIWGILHTVSRADLIRATVQSLERYMQIAYEQSKSHGPKARQFVILFDMEGFNVKQYVWRPASEVVITLIKNYEANYPEILKSCYIINVPKVFAFVFNIVKKFLDEYTLSKIHIYKHESTKWLPQLLDQVDESQIPKYFGGTMTDPDGNPKCITKIQWGGIVPKDQYTENDDDSMSSTKNANQFIEATIQKASRLKLRFKCVEPGSLLRWEFKTYDHDIRFGVKRVNEETGDENIEIPLQRVSSHQLNEEGFIACQLDWTYTILFDNSYSYFKNKKIRYFVKMENPVNIEEIEKGADQLTISN